MPNTESVYIVYPERRHVPGDVIAQWFADAVADNEISPEYLDAKSPDEMAKALDDAGIITRGKP